MLDQNIKLLLLKYITIAHAADSRCWLTLSRSICAVVRLFLDALTTNRSAVAQACVRKWYRAISDRKMACIHLSAQAWQCRTSFSTLRARLCRAQRVVRI